MPIRPEFLHFYRGEGWARTRGRILARAENKCELCGVPNSARVLRVDRWWRFQVTERWRILDRTRPADLDETGRRVRIVITVAHLNHTPGDDRDENLKAVCQWCHLDLDKAHHKDTRSARKDAARPLLEGL